MALKDYSRMTLKNLKRERDYGRISFDEYEAIMYVRQKRNSLNLSPLPELSSLKPEVQKLVLELESPS